MIQKTKLTIFLSLTLFSTFKIYAQEDFSLKLLKAEQLYSKGKLELITPLLKNEIKSSIPLQQKIRGYELLSQAHLYNYQKEEGIHYIHKLLHLDPFYNVDERVVSNEFVAIVESFSRRPFMFYSFEFGGGMSNADLITEHSISNRLSSNSLYKYGTTFSSNFCLGVYIFPWLSLRGGIGVKSHDILYQEKQIVDVIDISVNEQRLFLNYLASLDIDFTKTSSTNVKSKWYPFVRLGGSFNQLKKSEFSINATYHLVDKVEYTSDKVDYLKYRYPEEVQLFGGIGLKKRLKKNVFSFWLQYQYSLNDLSLEGRLYEESELLNSYAYVDNEVRFSQMTFNIGIQHHFYKIKFKQKK